MPPASNSQRRHNYTRVICTRGYDYLLDYDAVGKLRVTTFILRRDHVFVRLYHDKVYTVFRLCT